MSSSDEAPRLPRASRRGALVGRARELEDLQALLAKHALVTVVGTAGVGKTCLAREAAAHGPRLTFFCDATGASSADDLLRAVAGVLAIEPGEGDAVERIASVLAAKGDVSLLLDGVDRLEAGAWAETLGSVLDVCPELHVLATARVRLRTEGEVVLPLAPLPLDVVDDGVSPAEELFLRRAEEATGRDLRVGGRVPGDVRALVRALDGIPLALEIAAAASNVLTPGEFLQRRSVVLDAPAPGEAWGGGSLRAALEVSWQRLDAELQEALAAATVFSGDFELTAAEAVLGPRALGQLARLCEASFVASTTHEGRTRFLVFECVRQFVIERGPSPGAQREARASHAAFFGSQGIGWTLRGEGGERLAAIAWLVVEARNLEAVARRVLAPDAQPADVDIEHGAGALAGLAWLWIGRGPIEPHTRLLLEMEALVRHPSLESSVSVATFLLALARVRRHLGDFEAATLLVDDALRRGRRLAMPPFVARCLLERARLAQLRRDLDSARASVDAAHAIGDATDDDGIRVLAILSSRLAGRPLDHAALEQAADLAQKTGDPLVVARVELAFGTMFFASGRPTEALARLERAERASDLLGQSTWRALAGIVSGNALAELGRIAEARAKLEATLASARWTAHRRSEAEARGHLALLDFEAGHLVEAAEGLRSAVELFSAEAPQRLFFAAALAAVEALQTELSPGPIAQFAAARDRAHLLAPALGVEIDLFGEMLELRRGRSAARNGGAAAGAAAPLPDGAARVAMRVRENVRARLARHALVVGRDAAWFRPPNRATVSLATRPVLRALLAALVQARVSSAHGAVSREELIAAIWPEERSSSRSLGNRLSVAISTLRGLGVRAVGAAGQGVGIAPEVPIIQRDESEPPLRAPA